MTDFPKNAEEARTDRDVTREELTETLDALGNKLDVKSRVKDNLDAKVGEATGSPRRFRSRRRRSSGRAPKSSARTRCRSSPGSWRCSWRSG
jgi:hypothetical protein